MGLPGECQFHLDGVLLGLWQMNISLGVKAWGDFGDKNFSLLMHLQLADLKPFTNLGLLPHSVM